MDTSIRSSQELEQKTNGKRINKQKAVQKHHAAGGESEIFRYDNQLPRIYSLWLAEYTVISPSWAEAQIWLQVIPATEKMTQFYRKQRRKNSNSRDPIPTYTLNNERWYEFFNVTASWVILDSVKIHKSVVQGQQATENGKHFKVIKWWSHHQVLETLKHWILPSQEKWECSFL